MFSLNIKRENNRCVFFIATQRIQLIFDVMTQMNRKENIINYYFKLTTKKLICIFVNLPKQLETKEKELVLILSIE